MAIHHVLIVDDSPTERYYLSDILIRQGYSVSTAETAKKPC
jgi:twitching motility two-component system response regulator PilH